MKKIENLDIEQEIVNLYINQKLSIRKISTIIGYSTSFVTRVLKTLGYYNFNSGEQTQKRIFENIADLTWAAKHKSTGDVFHDYMNHSGVLTRYVLNHNLPTLPSKYIRSTMEQKTGKFWYEEFFDIIQISINEIKKCNYCDWITVDIDNKSGAFTNHLKEFHNINTIQYLNEFPAESGLFKTFISQQEDKTFLTASTQNFVICKLCDTKMKKISNTHLMSKHNITLPEYRNKYGNTISETTRELLKNNTIENNKILFKYNVSKKNNLEIMLSDCLNKMEFSHEYNKSIGKHFFDFYLPDYDLFLEADGAYWHGHDRNCKWHFNIFRNVIKDVKKTSMVKKLCRLIEGKSINLKNINQITSKDAFFNFCEKEHFNINNHKLFNLKEHEIIFDKVQCNDLKNSNNTKYIDKILYDLKFLMLNFYTPEQSDKFINIDNRNTIESKLKGVFFNPFYSSHKINNKNLFQIFYHSNILERVIKYRLGINKSNELFDITIKNIYKGIEVMTMFHVGVFPVKQAENIYYAHVNNGNIVYDPFAGWGTRWMGMKGLIYNKNCHYIGTDINSSLENGYKWIKKTFYEFYPNSNVMIHDSCNFINDLRQKVDFIFTSPPFYNDEIYNSNSANTFETMTVWKENLLLPVFQNCFNYLKSGSKFFIDMKEKYCDIVIEASTECGFAYLGDDKYNVGRSHYSKTPKQQSILKFVKP